MGSPTKVAVIGAGYFARFHYEAWSRMADVELVGLCEKDAQKGAEVAAAYGVSGSYGDLDVLLSQARPDLVDIVVPPSAHLEVIARLVEEDLAISCQKPFCGGLEGARKAVALARNRGRVLAVHENFRFQPWYREIKRLLDDGLLGDVYQVSFRLRPGDGQGPEAYLDRQPYFQRMKRFLIHETAIHLIDCFRFLLGEPSGLFARLAQLNPAIAGEDAGFIVFEFGDRVRGLFDGNRLADHIAENRRRTMGDLSIEGAKASLRLDGDGRIWLRSFGSNREQEHGYAWDDRGFAGDCVYACHRHLLNHLREGTPLETAAEHYLINQAIEEAVYRSHEEGRWIKAREWQSIR
ncbi:Gfo/Idh/MocA family protein [Limibacillus halophilus]|uniref:Putative dehydrogenase n=1 Tax=Limibacillus halophilus TaxID=1579333 RepID=A0A839SQ37_9PROT|nr:Gfo/Idh/MocA family oxidoreductase [Limibacillus halophilus]MBB3064572.1 putative dehydrogenase [Limibacillus halophilus]